MFAASRAYVPFSFFLLYRRGVFGETFTFGEAKYIARVVIGMHLIDCLGHLLFKWWTNDCYNRHIRIDPMQAMKNKKAELDSYIVQKSYFKAKKDNP